MRRRIMTGVLPLTVLLTACGVSAPTAAVGECLDISVNASTVTELAAFDCAIEHDAEVYYVGDVTAPTFDPLAVAEDASAICREEFATFIGIAYEDSALDIYYLYPQADSWEGGDREVICAVYTPDADTGRVARTSGSLAGAER